jgi:hypothetical protein
MIIVIVTVALLAIPAIWVITMLWREERRERRGVFPLILPVAPVGAAGRAPVRQKPSEVSGRVAEAPIERKRPLLTVERGLTIETGVEPDVSSTVRFRRPSEDAIQVLPGRLEVLAGESQYKEFRLVRVPGERP